MHPGTMRRAALWTAGILLGLALLLALAAGGALLWLRSEPGRAWLATKIGEATAGSATAQVSMRGIGPGLPWRIAVDEILVADRRGVWLRLEDVLVRPDLWELLRRAFHFEIVSAGEVDFRRPPESGPQPSEAQRKDEEGTLIPDLPEIRVEELAVHRLLLGPELTGRAMSYSVRGGLATSQGVTTAALEARSFERAEDVLLLDGRHVQAENALTISLTYNETPGGLLGSLLNLPDRPGIRLDLRGDGPLRDWRGELSAQAGDLFALQTRLIASAVAPYSANLRGTVRVAERLLPDDVAGLVGNEATFRLVAKPGKGGAVAIVDSGVRTQGVILDLEGLLDPDGQTMDVTARVVMPELVNMVERLGLGLEISEPLILRAQGPLAHPALELRARAEYLRGGGVSLDKPSLTIKARLPREGQDSGGLETELGLEARTLSASGEVLLHQVKAGVEAATPDFERFRVQRLAVRSRELALSGSAQGNLAVPTGQANLHLAVEELSRLASPTGMRLAGNARLDADLRLAETGVLDVSLGGRLAGLAGLPEPLLALTGPRMSLAANLAYANQEVRLGSLMITGRDLRLEAHGSADLAGETFGLDFMARLPEIAAATKAAGLEAGGGLVAKGQAKGRFTDFGADLSLDSQQLRLMGETFTHVRAMVSAVGLPGATRARLGLALGTPLGQAEAATVASHDAGRGLAQLQDTRLELPGLRVTSPSVAIRTESGLVDGELQAEVSSLKFISAFLDTPLDAQGSLSLRLDARNGKQAATAQGHFSGLRVADAQVASLRLQADLTDLLGTPGGTAEATVQEVRQDEMLVSSASLSARGGLERLTFSARTQGEWAHPFQASLEGFYGQGRDGWSAGLDMLRASVAETPIMLRRPFRVTGQGQGYALDNLLLGVADATISAQGRLRPDSVDARLRVDDFPAELLPFLMPKPTAGRLNAELAVNGSPRDPRLALDLRLGGVRYPGLRDFPALGLEADVDYARGGVRANARILGGSGASGALRAAFPAKLSLSPFAFDLPADGRLAGDVDARLDLTILPTLLQIDDQTMDGTVQAALDLSGTLGDPRITGSIGMDGGRYQNLNTGTVLDKLRLTARAAGTSIRLERLTATDGGDGRITAEGNLEFGDGLAYTLMASLRSATLTRMPEVTSTASGNLDLRGNAQKAALGGRITLERTEVSIPESLPPEVVELDVQRINVPAEDKGEQDAKEAQARAFDMGLDVNVRIPNQLFVRGRGLVAEFRGDLDARGSTDAPELVGTLELIRGRFEFLGQNLNLSEGIIRFTGAVPPNPQFTLAATTTVNEVKATMRVMGTADDLDIDLSSDPPLPQDEILARLVFGQALGNLSPFQAIQLAQAVQQLRGGGGGPDIQGGFRRFLGLDELTVGEAAPSAGGGYTLEAGKYITDNVYLRLDKGITAEEDKVGVVIELTPSINLESEAGTTSGMGLGLFWQKDY